MDSCSIEWTLLSQHQAVTPILLSTPVLGEPEVAQDLLVDQPSIRHSVVCRVNSVLPTPMPPCRFLLDSNVSEIPHEAALSCPWRMQGYDACASRSTSDFQSDIRYRSAVLTDLHPYETPNVNETEACAGVSLFLWLAVSRKKISKDERKVLLRIDFQCLSPRTRTDHRD